MKRFKTLLEAAGVHEPIRGTRRTRTSTRKIDLSQTAGPYAMWLEPPQLSADLNTLLRSCWPNASAFRERRQPIS